LVIAATFAGALGEHRQAFAQLHPPSDVANTVGGQVINGMATVEMTGRRPLLDASAFGCVPPPDYNSWGVTTYSAPIVLPSLKNSPSDDCRVSPKSSHPVIIATGEKVQVDRDFTDYTLGGLSQERTYRSMPSSRPARLFGEKWFSTWDFPALEYSSQCTRQSGHSAFGCFPEWINVSFPDGRTFSYSFAGFPLYLPRGYRSGNSPLGHLMTTDVNTVRLTLGSRDYTYDRRTRNLMSIDENGLRLHTFEYQLVFPDYQLSSVTARNGRKLTFVWSQAWNRGRVTRIRNSSGEDWAYDYDAGGNLVKVVPASATPSAGEKAFHYEDLKAPSLLTGVSVDGMRRTRVAYDGVGRVVRSGFDNGQEFDEFSYGDAPLSTTVTSHLGQVTRYDFDVQGTFRRLVNVARSETSSVAAAQMSLSYNGEGLLESRTDWNGVKTEFKYGSYGILEEVGIAKGTRDAAIVRFSWDGRNLRSASYFDADETKYLEETIERKAGGLASGWPTSETRHDLKSGQKRHTSLSYDFHPNGMLAEIRTTRHLPDGTADHTVRYDQSGRLMSVANPHGDTVTNRYHSQYGRPTLTVDENGIESHQMHDDQGRLTTLRSHDFRARTDVEYSGDDEVTYIRTSQDGVRRYRYNAAGKLALATMPDGHSISYSPDPEEWKNSLRSIRSERWGANLDGATLRAHPLGEFRSVIELDSLGRKWKERDSVGAVRSYAYDGNGNLHLRIDADGRTWRHDYTPRNRISSITAPDGSVTLFEYDAKGHPSSVTAANGLITRYEYNGFGEMISEDNVDSGRSTFEYDIGGRLTHHHRAGGKTVHFKWDALDRLTRRSVGPLSQTFGYDEGQFGKGRLTSFYDDSGSTQLMYNRFGKVVEQSTTILNIWGGEYKIKLHHDFWGRPNGVTYPDGTRIHYALDDSGRVERIESNLSAAPVLIRSIKRQPASDVLLGWLYGNGQASIAVRDEAGRLTNLGDSPVMKKEFRYIDRTNQLQGVTDHVHARYSRTFQYDLNDRLTSEAGTLLNDKFVVDSVGARTKTERKETTSVYTYFPGSNRLQGISGTINRTYEYDPWGNITDDGQHRLTFDDFGRLQTVGYNGVSTQLLHDALGRRVMKGGRVFIYAQDGRLMFERGQSNSNYVWLEGQLVGLIRDKAFYPVHADHLGRPEVLTDKTGSVVWRAKNSAFDREVELDKIGGFHIGFPGQYWDEEFKLWSNWHRFYDGSTGRYISVDPLATPGTDPYIYADGNPVANTDPMGLTPEGAQNFVSMIWKRFPPNPNFTFRSDGLPQGFGCGDKNSDIVTPDLFPQSCEKHDACYAAQCGQESCDRKFYADMRAERPDKYVSAYVYYQAVRLWGDRAYEKARKAK
jgi:RHS repeat-associated protein